MRGKEKSPGVSRKRFWTNEQIVMGTGVAGVVVVAISTCITAYQAIVMRAELNNTVDQQRAWVKVEAIPKSFGTDNQGAFLFLTVRATNVGSVPALGVEATSALWPAPGPSAMNKRPLRRDGPECPKPSARGTVIFPGESVDLIARSPSVSASDVKYLVDKENRVQMVTVVCATYRSGARTTLRHTIASFVLEKRTPEGLLDTAVDASRERIIPPILQLSRMGAVDRAD